MDKISPLLKNKKLLYNNVNAKGSSVVLFELENYFQIIEIKEGEVIEREIFHKTYTDKDAVIKFINQNMNEWE